MITATTGSAYGEDAYACGVEAASAAKGKLTKEPSLVIVFASVLYNQNDVLRGVQSVVGKQVALIGSSTAGEITEVGPLARSSVVVMLLCGEGVQFHIGIGENVKAGALDAGKNMTRAVLEAAHDAELKLLVMFPDVLNGNGADIVRGAQDVLGEHFPIVGGASGDDFKFQEVYQYIYGEVHTNAVVGVGISGDFAFGVGVKHGWIPIGPPMVATKSEGSVLHEVDGKPAVSVYEEYFGGTVAQQIKDETLAKLAITYPLGIHVPGSEELLIRDPLSVDEEGSITCAAEIPQDSEIRLMVGSSDDAITVAAQAAQKVANDLGKNPSAILIFNCIARSKLFGERKGEEITTIQEPLGADTPLAGFYTYGEQAPLEGETVNIEKCNPSFHNETVVILGIA